MGLLLAPPRPPSLGAPPEASWAPNGQRAGGRPWPRGTGRDGEGIANTHTVSSGPASHSQMRPIPSVLTPMPSPSPSARLRPRPVQTPASAQRASAGRPGGARDRVGTEERRERTVPLRKWRVGSDESVSLFARLPPVPPRARGPRLRQAMMPRRRRPAGGPREGEDIF
eukprot:scaffold3740_cov322-Prasinococcus_capsulatus_cf.AAC.17